MGVAQPFKGSRADWLGENGFEPVVLEERGRHVIRRFPRDVERFQIALRTSLIEGVAEINRDLFRPGLWRLQYRGESHYAPTVRECWELFLETAV